MVAVCLCVYSPFCFSTNKIRAFRLPHVSCRHTLYIEHVLKSVNTDKTPEIRISKIAPSGGLTDFYGWKTPASVPQPNGNAAEALLVRPLKSTPKDLLKNRGKADCSGLVKTCTGTSSPVEGYFHHQRPTLVTTYRPRKNEKMWLNMLHVW